MTAAEMSREDRLDLEALEATDPALDGLDREVLEAVETIHRETLDREPGMDPEALTDEDRAALELISRDPLDRDE